MSIGSSPPLCGIWGSPPGRCMPSAIHWTAHYIRRQLPKSSGGVRELSVPDPLLKHIQRQILRVLLVHMPVSPYATAYRYGGSTLCNAAPHVGKPCVLKLDIRHFFDSILYSAVRKLPFQLRFMQRTYVFCWLCCATGGIGCPRGRPHPPASPISLAGTLTTRWGPGAGRGRSLTPGTAMT